MRAALYARVSSAAQRDRQTIEAQLRALPAFAAARGWTVIGTYVDDGRSAKAGRLEARDGFARLLRDAAARAFDVVVVVALDRLTRSEDLGERGAILGAFQRAGVKIAVASTGQVLDLATSEGDLQSVLFAFFAAEENRKRRERTIAGKQLAITRGRKPAGPTPYALRYDRASGEWSIDPDEAFLVREIFQRILAGDSCGTIATAFLDRGAPRPRGGMWTRERVWDIASSRTYRGEWTADRRRAAVIAVPAIIDVATWEAVQAALGRHGRRGLRKTRHVYLLEGLATCAVCGSNVGVASAQSGGPRRWGGRKTGAPARYVCSHRRRPPHGGARCTLPYRTVADVDERVWRALLDTLGRDDLLAGAAEHEAHVAQERAAWEADLESADRRLARLTRSETELLARSRRGLVSDAALEVELAAIARERAMVDRQRETARRALVAADRAGGRAEALREALRQAREQLAAASPIGRQHVVQALLEPGSVTISATEVVATLRLAVGGPVLASSTSSSHENTVRVRVVA